MVTTAAPSIASVEIPSPPSGRPRRVDPLRAAGPTPFVTVMGTGMVANAVVLAPVDGAVARAFAVGAWTFAMALLILATAVTVGQLRRRSGEAAPAGPGAIAFWGTVPMALTTLGAGALLNAVPLLGDGLALALGLVLCGAGTVLGVAVAVAWLVVATTIVVRAVRHGLPFALTWWSFTFPIGTCVSGTSLLAARTDAAPVSWLAVALLVVLLAAWGLVVVRTAIGVLRRGAAATR